MNVFVSSTYSDLRAYREAAFDVLRRLGLQFSGLEYFSATLETPLDRTTKAVENSDLLLLLIGHRYGFVPAGHDKSVTELEYAHAKARGLPVLAFMLSEDVPVRPSDIEQDDVLRRRLASFRSEVQRSHIVGIVKSVEDLQSQLTAALVRWLSERSAVPLKPAEQRIAELESELEEQRGVTRSFQDRLRGIVPANPIWRGRNFTLDELSCFILMPFQDEFFEVYEKAFAPAVERCGLSARHAGEIFGNREIVEDIWDSICRCRLVVADVTGRNPNVFYELGVCHTLGKECVVVTQSDQDVPFDIRHRRYLKYKPAKPTVLRTNLERTIKAVLTQGAAAPGDAVE
jgi:hypothetical protein